MPVDDLRDDGETEARARHGARLVGAPEPLEHVRSVGLGEICQAWGGVLSGLRINPAPPRWTWPGANQGSLVICLRIDLFTDPASFRKEIDAYVRTVRTLAPLPGFDRSLMPGGIEAEREREYRATGVPIGPQHRERLETLANELEMPAPW